MQTEGAPVSVQRSRVSPPRDRHGLPHATSRTSSRPVLFQLAGSRADGRLVVLDDFGRNAAAFLDVVTVSPGPCADLGGVDGTGAGTAATGGAPGGAAGLAAVGHVVCQHLAQLFGVPGAEVDLVLGPVDAEANGAFRCAAVDVVDKQRLNLLCHAAYLACRLPDLRNSVAGYERE